MNEKIWIDGKRMKKIEIDGKNENQGKKRTEF